MFWFSMPIQQTINSHTVTDTAGCSPKLMTPPKESQTPSYTVTPTTTALSLVNNCDCSKGILKLSILESSLEMETKAQDLYSKPLYTLAVLFVH
jgi:hypothetical protein